MPRCVNCNRPAEALYTTYSAGHYSLLECAHCKLLIDPLIEHCIYNRNGDWKQLAVALLAIDAFVRWWPHHSEPSNVQSSLHLLFYSFWLSLSETAVFFAGVTVACHLLKQFDKHNPNFIPSLAPLALLYSSFPPALLLFLSLIWLPSSHPSSPSQSPDKISSVLSPEILPLQLQNLGFTNKLSVLSNFNWDREKLVKFALKRVYAVAGVWVVMGGQKRDVVRVRDL